MGPAVLRGIRANLDASIAGGSRDPDLVRLALGMGAITTEGARKRLELMRAGEAKVVEREALVERGRRADKEPLDPTNPKDRKAVDLHYKRDVKARFEAMAGKPEKTRQLVKEAKAFVKKTGVVPKAMLDATERGLESEDPEGQGVRRGGTDGGRPAGAGPGAVPGGRSEADLRRGGRYQPRGGVQAGRRRQEGRDRGREGDARGQARPGRGLRPRPQGDRGAKPSVPQGARLERAPPPSLQHGGGNGSTPNPATSTSPASARSSQSYAEPKANRPAQALSHRGPVARLRFEAKSNKPRPGLAGAVSGEGNTSTESNGAGKNSIDGLDTSGVHALDPNISVRKGQNGKWIFEDSSGRQVQLSAEAIKRFKALQSASPEKKRAFLAGLVAINMLGSERPRTPAEFKRFNERRNLLKSRFEQLLRATYGDNYRENKEARQLLDTFDRVTRSSDAALLGGAIFSREVMPGLIGLGGSSKQRVANKDGPKAEAMLAAATQLLLNPLSTPKTGDPVLDRMLRQQRRFFFAGFNQGIADTINSPFDLLNGMIGLILKKKPEVEKILKKAVKNKEDLRLVIFKLIRTDKALQDAVMRGLLKGSGPVGVSQEVLGQMRPFFPDGIVRSEGMFRWLKLPVGTVASLEKELGRKLTTEEQIAYYAGLGTSIVGTLALPGGAGPAAARGVATSARIAGRTARRVGVETRAQGARLAAAVSPQAIARFRKRVLGQPIGSLDDVFKAYRKALGELETLYRRSKHPRASELEKWIAEVGGHLRGVQGTAKGIAGESPQGIKLKNRVTGQFVAHRDGTAVRKITIMKPDGTMKTGEIDALIRGDIRDWLSRYFNPSGKKDGFILGEFKVDKSNTSKFSKRGYREY